tara:strand:- start:422 stop:547 length:126 start_codon:yes stop_codon:yes gene_type:complete
MRQREWLDVKHAKTEKKKFVVECEDNDRELDHLDKRSLMSE